MLLRDGPNRGAYESPRTRAVNSWNLRDVTYAETTKPAPPVSLGTRACVSFYLLLVAGRVRRMQAGLRIVGAHIECARVTVIAVGQLRALPIHTAHEVTYRGCRVIGLTLDRVNTLGAALRNLIIRAAALVSLANIKRAGIAIVTLSEHFNTHA